MKKIFFALAAVAALVACSKSEAQYDDIQQEFTLTPVTKNITKSMITGNKFPTTESFNVWAWYKQVDPGSTIAEWTPSDNEHLYISEGEFVRVSGANDTWKGKTSYYWPKVGSLLFAGYYPTTINENVEYNFNSTQNEMVFKNIRERIVEEDGYSEDIMYFNITEKSSNSGPVAVIFKHALSWITVNLSRPEDNHNAAVFPKILVNSVSFTNVNPQGTGTVTGSDGTISWETNGTPQDAFVTPAEGVVLTKAVQKQTEPLFIPQTFTNDMELKVNYTIFSSSTEYFTETYSIKLNGMKGLEGTTAVTLGSWEPAKHYTYNISIGLEEILIKPVVDNWVGITAEVPVQ